MKTKKLIAAALAACCALCLAACAPGGDQKAATDQGGSAQEAPMAPSQQLDDPVLETGYSQLADGSVNFGVIVSNPNDGAVFPAFTVDVRALDKNGATVAEESYDLQALLAGEAFGFGATLPVEGNAEVADVQATCVYDAPSLSNNANPLQVSAPQQDGTDGVMWRGEFFNETEDTLAHVAVGAVAYDSHEQIIGGGWEALSQVGAGTTGYDVRVPVQATHVEAYAHLSDLALGQ